LLVHLAMAFVLGERRAGNGERDARGGAKKCRSIFLILLQYAT
jgi:hypothetical protein